MTGNNLRLAGRHPLLIVAGKIGGRDREVSASALLRESRHAEKECAGAYQKKQRSARAGIRRAAQRPTARAAFRRTCGNQRTPTWHFAPDVEQSSAVAMQDQGRHSRRSNSFSFHANSKAWEELCRIVYRSGTREKSPSFKMAMTTTGIQ
jgi:hypothetical protein